MTSMTSMTSMTDISMTTCTSETISSNILADMTIHYLRYCSSPITPASVSISMRICCWCTVECISMSCNRIICHTPYHHRSKCKLQYILFRHFPTLISEESFELFFEFWDDFFLSIRHTYFLQIKKVYYFLKECNRTFRAPILRTRNEISFHSLDLEASQRDSRAYRLAFYFFHL